MSFGLYNSNKTWALKDFGVQMSKKLLKLQRNEMLREGGKHKYLSLFSSVLWQALPSVDLCLFLGSRTASVKIMPSPHNSGHLMAWGLEHIQKTWFRLCLIQSCMLKCSQDYVAFCGGSLSVSHLLIFIYLDMALSLSFPQIRHRWGLESILLSASWNI